MRLRRSRTLVTIATLTAVASCTPTASPGGVATLPFTYGNCAGPSAEYVYRFNPTERLDVFPHISGTSKGTILFIHGGGFNDGDKRGNGAACGAPGLASLNMGAIMKQREVGWDIVSINYRLTTSDPATKFPGALVDSLEALRWLQGTGGQIVGLNRSKVIVAGHSAGGALAALLAGYAGRSAFGTTFPRFDGWIAVSAPLHHGGTVAGNDQIFDSWVAGNVFGLGVNDAVPSVQLRAGSPVGYLIHGVNDPVISIAHSRAIRDLTGPQKPVVILDEVTPDRNKPGEANDRDHWAIGGADFGAFNLWLQTR